jgi:hypothetical protein
MHALSSLAGFRRQGRAPALPVLVTDLREPFTSADWAKTLALAIRDAHPRDLTSMDWSAPYGEQRSTVMPL